jgi:hypothetical protein
LKSGLERVSCPREAGCFYLSVGNESGSEDMLATLRKGFSKKEILKAVEEPDESRLPVSLDRALSPVLSRPERPG